MAKAKDTDKQDAIPESEQGIELSEDDGRKGDDQSQAGQKRGGGDQETPRRIDSDSAKEGIDGQNRDKRNGEGFGRI